MSEYNKTVLTNAGLDLVARANKGSAKFTITKAATSTEQLSDKSITELQQLTELPSLMQYGVINDVSDMAQDSNTVIGVELVFNNQDLANGYNINTIGLFAKEDGSTKELLYAVTTAITPESMPDFKSKVLFKFNMTMFVAIAQADNVAINVNDNGVVTQKQLTTVIEDAKKEIVDGINQLSALAEPSNLLDSEKINLDSFFNQGITKFTNCQLQSTGRMVGLNKDAANLSGLIFNVPNKKDQPAYQQFVYIFDYGSGTQAFMRLRSDPFSTNQEDFEKLSTDRDIAILQEAIKNAGQVKAVDNHKPDEYGNVFLSSFKHPDVRYKKGDRVDLDLLTGTGIYHLTDATLICSVNPNALNSVPRNRDNTTFSGFVKVDYHDFYNITQTLMIYTGSSTPDFTISTRSVSASNDAYRPIFRRLLNIDDFNILSNKIDVVENKELVHQCDDLASGIEYSKAHPNVLVATS